MLGAMTEASRIQVGRSAQRDPILAYSTVMAANLLKIAAKRKVDEPVAWIRRELNKANPGDGDVFLKHARRMAGSKNADQSMFDALRLTIANRLATAADKLAIQHSASGLGDSVADIKAVFCGVMGTATVGGSIYGAASENPAGSSAIGTAGSGAMNAYGCSQQVMEQSTLVAQAEAQAAASALAAQQSREDRTLLIGGVAAGVIILGLFGVVIFKK